MVGTVQRRKILPLQMVRMLRFVIGEGVAVGRPVLAELELLAVGRIVGRAVVEQEVERKVVLLGRIVAVGNAVLGKAVLGRIVAVGKAVIGKAGLVGRETA